MNLHPATNSKKELRMTLDKIELCLRNLESFQQDVNHDIFITIVKFKLPKDVLLHLELQKGTRNKWSANKFREELKNYIGTCERAETATETARTIKLEKRNPNMFQ